MIGLSRAAADVAEVSAGYPEPFTPAVLHTAAMLLASWRSTAAGWGLSADVLDDNGDLAATALLSVAEVQRRRTLGLQR